MKQQRKRKVFFENSFSHNGTIGDVWASLPCVMSCCLKMNTKAIMYLIEGVKPEFHREDVVHPTKDKHGQNVMLNKEMINMMIPLLKEQPYIEDARLHKGEVIRVPLQNIREKTNIANLPYHPLSYWYFYIYPDTFYDVSKQYIFVRDNEKDFAKDRLIVCRTERYQNPWLDYHFLNKYEDRLLFAGTELEHIIFNARFGLNIPRLVVNDFLELAQALKQSVGLLANQTQIMQIAEGMKIKRAVELCKIAPNVTVQGFGGFEFYLQSGLELWVEYTLKGEDINLKKTKKTRVAGLKVRSLEP